MLLNQYQDSNNIFKIIIILIYLLLKYYKTLYININYKNKMIFLLVFNIYIFL